MKNQLELNTEEIEQYEDAIKVLMSKLENKENELKYLSDKLDAVSSELSETRKHRVDIDPKHKFIELEKQVIFFRHFFLLVFDWYNI
jgi:chromosome segregation ATPase